MINLGRSFSTSGLRMITNSSPTGSQHDRTKAYDHRIFLTILQPRSIPKVVFVPITTRFYERLVHLGKTLFFSRTLSRYRHTHLCFYVSHTLCIRCLLNRIFSALFMEVFLFLNSINFP